MESTVGLENLKNLEEIYLDNNKINDLTGLQNLQNLHKVSIKETPVSKNNIKFDLPNVSIKK